MEGEAFLMRCNFVDAEICQYRALQDAECAGQLCMVLAAHFLRLRAELLQGDMSGVEPTLRAAARAGTGPERVCAAAFGGHVRSLAVRASGAAPLGSRMA